MVSTIQDGETLPLLIGYLPEFAIKKCERELNESPEVKEKALNELRALLHKNKETTGVDFHQDLLIQFLRRNKYRIRDALKQLQNFAILNKTESYLFKSVPDHYFETASSRFLTLVPRRCPEGCALVIVQIAKWNPKEIPFECVKQMFLMLFFQLLRDPMNQIHGFKIIHNFQGTLPYLKYCTPRNLYLFYNASINCIPGRWKEIHLINRSVLMETVWTIIKPFLTQKITERVIIHSKPSDLFDYFPRSIIPTELGGTLLEPGTEDWIRNANKEQEKYSMERQSNFYSC